MCAASSTPRSTPATCRRLAGIAGVGTTIDAESAGGDTPVAVPTGLDRIQAFLEALALVTDLDASADSPELDAATRARSRS